VPVITLAMFSSIRFKLTLWYTCVLALIVTALAMVTYTLFVRALGQQTDRNIAGISASVAGSVTGEQDDAEREARSSDSVITEALDELHSIDYSFVVKRKDGTTVVDTADKAAGLPTDAGAMPFSTRRIGNHPFRIGHSDLTVAGVTYDLFVVYSLSEQRELEESVRDIFFVIVPVCLLLAAIGGYFLARRSLAPIADMGKRANRITAANLHERLPMRNANDELGSLATAFNDLLNRLNHEFDRQRRFVTDASHELRTPLAVIRGESDVALLNDQRPAAEYRDSLQVVNQESRRLSAIVEDLFTLARADSGKLSPRLKDVYVDEILAECVRVLRKLAESRLIEISMETSELLAKADEALLRRLFMNLLDNAIKYNYNGGSIRITMDGRSIKIGNTGALIPAEQAGMIFERFYRNEKAQAPDPDSLTSGAGLGLSIAKAVADVHHAQLEYSHLDIENIFTITFPERTE
jgi:heavy metal sensor kinase